MKCDCIKCRHGWFSRTEDKPIQCPKCKNYNWEKKRPETNEDTKSID